MKEAVNVLNHIITTGGPMQRSAAVLLLAYLNRDHTDRALAAACVRFLHMERALWGLV